jgi:hypothetical protein
MSRIVARSLRSSSSASKFAGVFELDRDLEEGDLAGMEGRFRSAPGEAGLCAPASA